MKITCFIVGVCCVWWGITSVQAQNHPAVAVYTEAQVAHYRQSMQRVGEYLAQNNNAKALGELLMWANQGFAEAQYILATLYLEGLGTAVDRVAAQKWLVAAVNSNNEAVRILAQEALEKMR